MVKYSFCWQSGSFCDQCYTGGQNFENLNLFWLHSDFPNQLFMYIYKWLVCRLLNAQHKITTYMFSISLVLRSHDCSWRRLQNTGICRGRMPLNREGTLTAHYLDTGPRCLRCHPKDRLNYVAFDDKEGYWGLFQIGIPMRQAEIRIFILLINCSWTTKLINVPVESTAL